MRPTQTVMTQRSENPHRFPSLGRLTVALGLRVLATAICAPLVLTACAGPQLQRLDGEPKSTWPFTISVKNSEKPVVAGIKRFIKVAKAGRGDLVYRQLSALTKRALAQRAKAVGKRGADLLQPAPKSAGPGAAKLHIADPLAGFALRGAVSITAGPDPYPATKPADGRTIEQRVTLKTADGRERHVTMRFEGLHWRVHNPTLVVAPAAPNGTK
jgi:hypothetical protein